MKRRFGGSASSVSSPAHAVQELDTQAELADMQAQAQAMVESEQREVAQESVARLFDDVDDGDGEDIWGIGD
jgi:hypothetical protein